MQHNGHIYYVLASNAAERTRLLGELNSADVNAVFHYVPSTIGAAGRCYGRSHGTLSVTQEVSGRVIRLPLYSGYGRDSSRAGGRVARRRTCRGPPGVRSGLGSSRGGSPPEYDRPRHGRAQRRRARREVIRGRLHRTPLLSCRTLGPQAFLEGGAAAAHRLVQAARRAHEARLADGRGEGARRHRDLGREPRAGRRVGRSRGGARRARRHVARRERGEDRGDARLRRRGRPRGGRIRARRSSGWTSCSRRPDGRSCTRSTIRCTIAGQGTVGLEILEDLPDVETIVVPVGGGGLISGIAVAAAGSARVIGVEPEGSTALHSALAAGERVERDADLDRRRAQRAARGPERACDREGARRGGRPRVPRVRSRRASASSTSGRNSPASRPARRPSAAVLAGKVDGGRTVCIVSGGNVAAATAAGILASR